MRRCEMIVSEANIHKPKDKDVNTGQFKALNNEQISILYSTHISKLLF